MPQSYEQLQAERDRLFHALDDIARMSLASRSPVHRTHWIATRAICALNNDDAWIEEQFPHCELQLESYIRERTQHELSKR